LVDFGTLGVRIEAVAVFDAMLAVALVFEGDEVPCD